MPEIVGAQFLCSIILLNPDPAPTLWLIYAGDGLGQGLRQKKEASGFFSDLSTLTKKREMLRNLFKEKIGTSRFSIIWFLTFAISTKEVPITNNRIVPESAHSRSELIRD